MNPDTADTAASAAVTSDVIPLRPLQRNLSVIAVLLATFMTQLDSSIVNVALPTISRDLHQTGAATVWVTTAFLLAVACCVPSTASLGDIIGRRRMFLIGVPAFTLASVACALSPTLPLLITSRVLQGAASAMVFAVAIPLYRRLFPPARLGSILGINAMTVALGTCAGPTLGGVILSGLPWPWLFLINVPVGVISFVLAFVNLPHRRDAQKTFDLGGAVLAAGAIACFIIGVHQLSDIAGLWWGIALLVAFGVLLAAFIRRERVAAHPLIPLPMFIPKFDLAVLTAFWSFFGQGVAFVALPFLFQSAYGASPLESALLFTPWPLMIVIVAPIAGRLADRVSPSLLAMLGLAVFSLGVLSLALLGSHPEQWDVLVRTGITGVGFALFQSPNNRDMMSAAPIRYSSSAAAVLNLNRTLGQSTGSAAVGMALLIGAAGSASLADEAGAAGTVLYVAFAGALVATVFSAVKLVGSRRAARA